jgi:hypothetical protein
MLMFVFVYTFIFWIYLPYMRENMLLLSFRNWLTWLTWCSPVPSIYL